MSRSLDVTRRNRVVDAAAQLLLDLAVFGAAQSHDRALARADDAGHDRHFVADDVVKKQRLVGLVDERRDMADVHRLPDVDELFGFAQAFEEFTEVFFHPSKVLVVNREGVIRDS